MADREGFEPPEDLHLRRFSRPEHSTTLPPIHNRSENNNFLSLKFNISIYLNKKIKIKSIIQLFYYNINYNVLI